MAEVINLDRRRRERGTRPTDLHGLALQIDTIAAAEERPAILGHAVVLTHLAKQHTGPYREALVAGARAIALVADLKKPTERSGAQ